MYTTFLLIVFLPLLGALISGVFGTKLLRGTQERSVMMSTITVLTVPPGRNSCRLHCC